MSQKIRSQILYVKSIKPHYHESELEILLVLKGTLTIQKIERELQVREGELTFINPGILHFIESEGAYALCTYIHLKEFRNIYDKIEYVEFMNMNEGQNFYRPLKERLTSSLIDFLIQDYLCQKDESDKSEEIEFYSNQIMHMLFNHFQIINNMNEKIINIDSNMLSRYYDIVKYINNHINEKIVTEDILNEVYMNPTYFSQFMKNVSGVRFKDFVKYRKLALICRYLIDSQYTITDIALLSGVSDMKSFYKLFNSFFNESPGKYRKYLSSINDDYEVIDNQIILKDFIHKYHIDEQIMNTAEKLYRYLVFCLDHNFVLKNSTVYLNPYKDCDHLDYYRPYRTMDSLYNLVVENEINLILVYDFDIIRIELHKELLKDILYNWLARSKLIETKRWNIIFRINDIKNVEEANKIKEEIENEYNNCHIVVSIDEFS